MLRRAARQVTQDYDIALRPTGLKLSQYSVLVNVERLGGQTITQLAARMMLDRTTLTRNLRPMAKAGWIRLESAGDRRATAVYLTLKGARLVESARPLWRKAEDSFRARLGTARLEVLNELIGTAIGGK